VAGKRRVARSDALGFFLSPSPMGHPASPCHLEGCLLTYVLPGLVTGVCCHFISHPCHQLGPLNSLGYLSLQVRKTAPNCQMKGDFINFCIHMGGGDFSSAVAGTVSR
jgi:hypothetical protein